MSNEDQFFKELREELDREQKRDVRKLIATIAVLIVEVAWVAWVTASVLSM